MMTFATPMTTRTHNIFDNPSYANDSARWQAVLDRDHAADGAFVTAVRSTRIYCRPTCPARHPKRENVTFYLLPAAAEAAGYRPCKRCHPREADRDPRLATVQAVCDYLRDHATEPDVCTLTALGTQFGFDPAHLQKLFKAALGLSPREYVEAYRLQAFKTELRETERVTDAVYSAGFGSPSRAYERGDKMGMTPAEYQRGGEGVQITYTTSQTPFGLLFVGATARGVCAVGLADDAAHASAALHAEYPRATITYSDDAALTNVVDQIVEHVNGTRPTLNLPLDIQATAFQERVWAELRRIPRGETRTYAQIAAAIGQPSAARAVAHACATNQAAVVIPCHRVVGSDGQMRGYKWGTERKAALLEAERN